MPSPLKLAGGKAASNEGLSKLRYQRIPLIYVPFLSPHCLPVNSKTERIKVVFMPRWHIVEHSSDAALLMLFSSLQKVSSFMNIAVTVRPGLHRRILAYIRMLLIFSEIGRCATHLQFPPDIAAKWSDQMRDVVRILCDQSLWLKLGKLGRPRHFGWEISPAIPVVREDPESLRAS